MPRFDLVQVSGVAVAGLAGTRLVGLDILLDLYAHVKISASVSKLESGQTPDKPTNMLVTRHSAQPDWRNPVRRSFGTAALLDEIC